MADITINESGMTFGPIPEQNLLPLETCKVYRRIQHGLPIAEFSYLKTGSKERFITIETKSSSPKSDNEPNFSKYIKEISSKLTNGFQLAHSLLLGRFGSAETPTSNALKSMNLADIEHRLVLVIHGHEKSWLPPVQDALRQELKSIEKIWSLGPNSILVINDVVARDKGLIQ